MVDHKRRIILNQEEIHVQDDQGHVFWRILWSDVKEIAAWKDDVFAYDIICFGFRTTDQPDYFWCDEQADGWDELMAFLKNSFGVGLENWFDQVAFPAFKRNFTTVWGKPVSDKAAPG